METATYDIAIAWEAIPDYAFILNSSALDSPKQLISAFYAGTVSMLEFGLSRFGGTDTFAGDFAGLYDNVTDDVKSFTITRGKTQNLDAIAAGEATIVLNDPTGKYNPLNTSSPLAPYVVPGRAIRISALYNGTTYGLYYGFIRSIEHDPAKDRRETKIMCQDIFLYLSRAKPIIGNLASPTTTGACIGRVLDSIQWTNTSLRQLATGDTISTNLWPGGTATGSNSALQLIDNLLASERGDFFHGKDGVVKYQSRSDKYRAASQVTLTNVSAGSAPATDITTIVNSATVSTTISGTTYSQSYQDGTSISNYGQSDAQSVSSPFINDAAQCLNLATWLVKQQSSPSSPVRALEHIANTSPALMDNALARELNERITVSDSASGVTSQDFFIQGISHDVSMGGQRHVVRFALAKVPTASPIIFGTSRSVNGSFSSPTTSTPPYAVTSSSSDVFAY